MATRFSALLSVLLLVAACGHAAPTASPPAVTSAPSVEVEGFVEVRQRSQALRTQVESLWRLAREEFFRDAPPTADWLARLREVKREYSALRVRLFETALLHAPAISQQPDAHTLPAMLIRSSLSVMAGTELVRNFHAVAALLSDSSACRLAWEAPDAEAGIPPGSWDVSAQAYRNASYRDLLRHGVARLGMYRAALERLACEGNAQVRALYPNGVDPALAVTEQVSGLLQAGLGEEDPGQDEREVRGLVHTSRLLRAQWTAAAPGLREAIAQDGGLVRGRVHARVQEAKREYLHEREALYKLAFKHVPKLIRQDIAYPRSFRLRAVGISLVAGVTLYENARTVRDHFLTIPGIRTLLNQGDPSLGILPGFWDAIEREFVRVEYRVLLEAAIRAVEDEQGSPGAAPMQDDPFLEFVARELVASAVVSEIRGERPDVRMGRALHHYLARLTTVGTGALAQGELAFSMGVGNFLGAFEFRKGKLFAQPHWVAFVRDRLQPGDLLVEKTPFRLTDKFIPGHFGHVAMYVGTEEQLRELGLLDHPWVARHRAKIARGHTIVEALRSGTQLNTIEQFLNVDDLAILRPKPETLPGADVSHAVALALSHVGKRYDFGFDANTWDTITCSELAFHSYINLRWPAHRIFGSYTINPDDVAAFAGSDASLPFRLMAFFHDGRLVHDSTEALDAEDLYLRLVRSRFVGASP